jgi:hypothetical protein
MTMTVHASPVPTAACAAAAGPLTPLWLDDLRTAAEGHTDWLWHGYLTPGNVTLLTSQWKSGKTTLVSVLLAKLRDGGTLAGRPLAAGKAAVVSEESPAQWYERSRKLAFGPHACWFCRPFRGRPSPAEWVGLLDRLAELRQSHGLDLVVIDPLASFLPGRGEGDAGTMLDALLPLTRLTALGVSVLVLHHPRKGDPAPGQAARGSGALSGFADILIEMRHYRRAGDGDRRRRLQAFSRFDATPRQLVIELAAEGTDYLAHGDFLAEEFTRGWETLKGVLAEAEWKLTRQKIAQRWPSLPPPADATLWRWLNVATERGLVCRDGSGSRASAYRYWLPGQEKKWRHNTGGLLDLPELY